MILSFLDYYEIAISPLHRFTLLLYAFNLIRLFVGF